METAANQCSQRRWEAITFLQQNRICACHFDFDTASVILSTNEEFEALFPEFQPSRVTITLDDTAGTGAGREFQQRVDVPKGDPRDPMTEEEIAVKFNALGRDVVGEKRCDQLRELIMNMDREQTLDRFLTLMMGTGS